MGVCSLQATELEKLLLERTEEGLFLSAGLRLTITPAMENALERAVPIYFVMQAEVLRNRWYWTDQQAAKASRTYRLAYQPLTRRWRVSVSSGLGPATGLQYALHQNYETLHQAVSSIVRVSRWRIVEPDRLDKDEPYYLNYQFKLDLALLPKPFQLGMTNQSDWAIDVRRSLTVPPVTAAPETNESTPSSAMSPSKS